MRVSNHSVARECYDEVRNARNGVFPVPNPNSAKGLDHLPIFFPSNIIPEGQSEDLFRFRVTLKNKDSFNSWLAGRQLQKEGPAFTIKRNPDAKNPSICYDRFSKTPEDNMLTDRWFDNLQADVGNSWIFYEMGYDNGSRAIFQHATFDGTPNRDGKAARYREAWMGMEVF